MAPPRHRRRRRLWVVPLAAAVLVPALMCVSLAEGAGAASDTTHTRLSHAPVAAEATVAAPAVPWVPAGGAPRPAAPRQRRLGDAAACAGYAALQVVDGETGRGVPCVQLRTSNDIRAYTDSAGLVAWDEPSLLNQPVFFSVETDGYTFPKDGFGYAARA